LLAILVVVGGFFHVVHGGNVGCTVIAKDGWALEDTFVDVDDYTDKPLIALLPKAKVVRALVRAGILRLPEPPDDDADRDPYREETRAQRVDAPRWYCTAKPKLAKEVSTWRDDLSICFSDLEGCNESRGDDGTACVAEAEAACFTAKEGDASTQFCLTPTTQCDDVRAWAAKLEGVTFVGPCEIDSARTPVERLPNTRPQAAAALNELQQLRDTACTCHTPACADRVQQEFDAFLERHKDTKGSEASAKKVGALAAELSACLDSARNAGTATIGPKSDR
jgi:hypothetical protein